MERGEDKGEGKMSFTLLSLSTHADGAGRRGGAGGGEEEGWRYNLFLRQQLEVVLSAHTAAQRPNQLVFCSSVPVESLSALL